MKKSNPTRKFSITPEEIEALNAICLCFEADQYSSENPCPPEEMDRLFSDTASEIDQAFERLPFVWAFPSDATHMNDTDANLFSLSTCEVFDTDSKSGFIKIVSSRWRIREHWCCLVAQLGLPDISERPVFQGYQHQESFDLLHWVREKDEAAHLLIDPEVGEFHAPAELYVDLIVEKGLIEEFKYYAQQPHLE